jgi:hypothetical protein
MNRKLMWSAAGAAALAAGLAGAQVYTPTPGYGYTNSYGYGGDAARAGVVRCESTGSRRNFCRVDTRGGVQLVRQLSRQPCVRGVNWRASADGIHVADGCRADFAVNRAYDGRYQSTSGYYTTDRYGRRVYTEGYGTTTGAYTTDRYGRPVYGDRYPQSGYYNDGRTVHCQSSGYGRTYCGLRGNHYTMVDRSPACIVERTWGDDAYGTWVSGNCNADFMLQTYPQRRAYDPADDVYYRNRDLGPPTTYPSVYGQDSYSTPSGDDVIYCQSAATGRTYCGDASRSYAMHYGSDAYCVEGRTYGRDSYGTWVSGGCNLTLEPEYEQ